MCGICGIAFAVDGPSPSLEVLNAMCQEMAHRGPDGRGVHQEPGLGLGFQRLAIIGREDGQQPLGNEDGSLYLVCNGEIYNHLELRRQLTRQGHVFRTHSDVETILHLYEEEGAGCLDRLRGMFAFALWDRRRRSLLLARDRLGIKPLYYMEIRPGRTGLLSRPGPETPAPAGLAFASEIKALLSLPEVQAVPDLRALHAYLTFRYVPAPATLFRGIYKLQPGHFALYQHGRWEDHVYWQLPWPPEPAAPGRGGGQEQEAADELISILDDAVRLHLQSEVPVGILLSGGVDSNAIMALAAGASSDFSAIPESGAAPGITPDPPLPPRPLRTFSLGFAHAGVPQAGFYELDLARAAARRFGAVHHEAVVGPDQVPASLAAILWHLEEPLGDPSIIPLYFISHTVAQAGVPVILSGEGADELFAGYEVYYASRAVRQFQRLPAPLRERVVRPLAGLVSARMPGHNLLQRLLDPVPSWYRGVGYTFPDVLKEALYSDTTRNALAGWDLQEWTRAAFPPDSPEPPRGQGDPLDQMLYFDICSWLPDDTLLKADKLTMAYSLELRVPFLDHRVVEFAATLPAGLKVSGNTLKYVLKKALANVLPPEVLQRKKVGFTAPMRAWLSEELYAYAASVLRSRRFRERGYFRDSAVRQLLQSAGPMSSLRSRQILTLVVLEVWHRLFVDGDRDLLGAAASYRPLASIPATDPIIAAPSTARPRLPAGIASARTSRST